MLIAKATARAKGDFICGMHFKGGKKNPGMVLIPNGSCWQRVSPGMQSLFSLHWADIAVKIAYFKEACDID